MTYIRTRISKHQAAILFVLVAPAVALAAISSFFGVRSFDVSSLHLLDPDNYLRLVQVRDLLGGQSWWDIAQYRMDPPAGIRMHWSRLADLPLAILTILFGLFTDPAHAEVLAITVAPPLLLLATLAILARAAHGLEGKAAMFATLLPALTSAFLVAQFLPGRVDHHGLQLLLLSGGIGTALARETRTSGIWLALCASLSLNVGLEAAPMFALIVAWLVGRWIWRGPAFREQLNGFILAMAVALPLVHFVTSGPDFWFQATHEQIGRGHIAIVVSSALVFVLLARSEMATPLQRIIPVAGMVVASLLCTLIFPEVLRTPYAEIDGLVREIWLDNVVETRSVFDYARNDPNSLPFWFGFVVLAVPASIWLAIRGEAKDRHLLLMLLCFGGLMLTAWQVRMNAIATLPAILVAACAIARAWSYWRTSGHPLPVVIVVLFINGISGIVFEAMLDKAQTQQEPIVGAAMSAHEISIGCDDRIAALDLDRFPPGLVLAPTASGGAILLHSHHSILASSAQRGHDANSRAFRIFVTPKDEALALMREQQIKYVLFCRDAEFLALAEHAADGLAAALLSGDPPSALQELERSADGSFGFYELAPR